MTRFPLSLLGFAVVMVAGLLPFSAFAQQASFATDCVADGSLSNVFCFMTGEVGTFPRLISLLSFIAGVIMTLVALLNLRQYGDDPTSIPLRAIIMKFSAAVMLMSLPLIIQLIVKTTTGRDISEGQEELARPCLYRKSNLMAVRGKGDDSQCN